MSDLLKDSLVMTSDGAMALQRGAIADGDLLIWSITANPSDHPGKMVARPFSTRLGRPLRMIMLADTLDELRDQLPIGLTRLARDPADDPVVVESWI